MLDFDSFDSGHSFSETSYGSIALDYNENKLTVCINDKHNSPAQTHITLEVRSVDECRFDPNLTADFDDITPLNLLNEWSLYRKDGQWYVHATDDDQLIYVKSNSIDIINDLVEISKYPHCQPLSFFKELYLSSWLDDEFGMSIDELQAMPNMDSEKMAYVVDYSNDILKLVKNGISLEKICYCPLDKLKRIVSSSNEMHNILQIVTLKQIFGVDHIPPALPADVTTAKQSTSTVWFGEASHGDYSYKYSNGVVSVSHKNSSTCKILSNQLEDEKRREYDFMAARTEHQVQLLHRWVDMPIIDETDDDQVRHLYYSPDTQACCYIAADPSFPMESFEESGLIAYLSFMPLYHEKTIENQLAVLGYSYEKMRAIDGMTQQKLELITKYMFQVGKLMEYGMTMEDFARADYKRMSFIFDSFIAVEDVFDFVEPQEVFGLNAPGVIERLYNSVVHPFSIFSSSSEQNTHVNDQNSPMCSIV